MDGFMICKLYLSRTFLKRKTAFLGVTEVHGTDPTLPVQEAHPRDTTGWHVLSWVVWLPCSGCPKCESYQFFVCFIKSIIWNHWITNVQIYISYQNVFFPLSLLFGHFLFLFFNLDFSFQSIVRLTAKLSGRYKDFYIPPAPTRTTPSPIINTFCQKWYICYNWWTYTFYHLKSIVTLWFMQCCTFYGFSQMYNNMYPTL